MECNDLLNLSTTNSLYFPSLASLPSQIDQKCSTPRESKDFDDNNDINCSNDTNDVDNHDLSCDLLRSSLINLENETTIDSENNDNNNPSYCLDKIVDDLLLYDDCKSKINAKENKTLASSDNFEIDSLSQSKFTNDLLSNGKSSARTHSKHDSKTIDIEREILKRQHCERQIQELHKRQLDLEEQLAVSSATDRKKDALINKLRKTLQKLIENWKKKEAEMSKLVKKITHDKQMALNNESNCINRVKFLEDETRLLNQELLKERNKFHDYQNEASIELECLKKDYTELQQTNLDKTNQLEQQQTKITLFRDEKDSLQQKITHLESQLDDKLAKYNQNEEEYLEKINTLALKNLKVNEKYEAMKSEYEALINEAKHVVQQSEIQYKQLIEQIDCEKRAKDGLQVQYNVLEEKLEQIILEHEQKIKKIEMSWLESEHRLVEKHAQHLSHINQEHQKDLNEFQIKCKNDLDAKINDYEEKITFLKRKIDQQQCEIASLSETNKMLDNDRNSIRQNLKNKLENQLQEVMQLIGTSSSLTIESSKKNDSLKTSFEEVSRLNKSSTLIPNLECSAFKPFDARPNHEISHTSSKERDLNETQSDFFIKYQIDRINKCYELDTDKLNKIDKRQESETLSARTNELSLSDKHLDTSTRAGELRHFIEMLLEKSPNDSTSTKIEASNRQDLNESPIRDIHIKPIISSRKSYSYHSDSDHEDEVASYYDHGHSSGSKSNNSYNRVRQRNNECLDEVRRNLDFDFESLSPQSQEAKNSQSTVPKPQKINEFPAKIIKRVDQQPGQTQKSINNSTKSSLSNLKDLKQTLASKNAPKRVWK